MLDFVFVCFVSLLPPLFYFFFFSCTYKSIYFISALTGENLVKSGFDGT